MIRRLFTLFVFCLTVLMAAYGQNIFGREHLVKIAHNIQAEGPDKARQVWKETDKMLANLVPEAGSAKPVCTIDNINWAISLYR
jgi:hypothetical protein